MIMSSSTGNNEDGIMDKAIKTGEKRKTSSSADASAKKQAKKKKGGKTKQQPKSNFRPFPSAEAVPTDTYHQIRILCVKSINEPVDKNGKTITKQYYAEDYVSRTIVIKSSHTVFDLVKATLCAFGLEGDEVSRKPYASHSMSGKIDLELGVCVVSDVKMINKKEGGREAVGVGQVPGLAYRSEKKFASSLQFISNTNALGDLKKIKIAQILDKPVCTTGAERFGGIRQHLALSVALSKRIAFISQSTGGQVQPMGTGWYEFIFEVEVIGSKKDHQSSFQHQLTTRCVGGHGGVMGGNTIDWDWEDNNSFTHYIDELNLRYAAGRKMTGLVGGSADPEEDFYSCSKWMSMPLFDICLNDDGSAYADPVNRPGGECVIS